ncbi:glycoside hydrolase domain-containing protein [Chitinophaga sp. Ak27]|uniref:glycoside hydrolase domain-containing protein n=1 Tax=Chitinophaga sp. Ak27 TaxID=2726116 RepID=UPI00145DE933|nr:glycoside hydrolase domain-containing protein [Chitinophaga sp. Ak27]NLU92231.1 DUF4091 domain-containing protein [Chitinophaga sp. Ak27]
MMRKILNIICSGGTRYAKMCIIIAGCLMTSCADTFSQNIADKAAIAVTPAPNYTLTKDKSQKEMLTDGRYASVLSFWKDPAALGWQNVKQVTIDFSFDKPVQVSRVNLNTVTGQKAEVSMPLSVLVFISNDQQQWQFLGDMTEQSGAKDEYYKIIPLSLKGLQASGKYVRVLAIPNGSYFFTDEIQIIAGKDNAGKAGAYKTVSDNDLPGFIKTCRDAAIGKRFSNEASSAAVAKSAPLSVMSATTSGQSGVTLVPLASPFSPDLQAVNSPVPIETFKGLSSYSGWLISNPGSQSATVTLSYTSSAADLGVNVYWAKPVKSRDFKVIPDALMELQSGASVELAPKENRLILMKTQARSAGNGKVTLSIKDPRHTASSELPVSVGNASLSGYMNLRPDVNVWAYFSDPLLQGREASARQDLLNHYVNTFVIPPGILLPNVPVASNQKLQAYLQYIKGFDKVLLYLDFSVNAKSGFLSDAWKQSFLTWYDALMKAIMSAGISADNVYLYPFDEVKPAQLNTFQQFADWIKSARKDARIFATISNAGTLKSIGNNLDICQLFCSPNILREKQQNYAPRGKNWLYDIKKPTKSLSPYGYYRLMAWKAYASGITGIGFWQYADVGHEANATSVWDDFDGKSADFAVIYDDGNKVLSSRRWEAFKAGVEDYMLLSAYARKAGQQAAMDLCRNVLANEGQAQAAEDARKKMIKTLGN